MASIRDEGVINVLEAFLNFVWNLIKEYGYSFLVAFVVGIVTIVKAPNKYIQMLPFGEKNIYWALAVCMAVYLLIIGFVVYVFKKISGKASLSSYYAKERERRNKENLQELWNYVDKFSESDRSDLKKFLETNNTPISKNGHILDYTSLYRTNWVVSIEKRTPRTVTAIEARTGKEVQFQTYSTHLYKLREEVYQNLKYSMEKYGRIGNFE